MKISNETLLCMVLSGKSQADIAREMGMSKEQVCRRVNAPDFQDLLAEYRKKMVDNVYVDLTANAQKAVTVLVDLLDDSNPFVRYNSACKILSALQDYSIQQDLMKSIEELKEHQRAEYSSTIL